MNGILGVAEVVRNGREGCVLESPDEISRATAFLLDLARDPAARARCGRHARTAAESLDLGTQADRILKLYRDVASQPSADTQGSTSSNTECSPGTPTRSGNP